MRVLVACEFSGIVRDAFIARGHDAWSCDTLPSERGGKHIQCDVLEVLDASWDLMIAHPPCTYLAVSGLHWNTKRPERAAQTELALELVRMLLDAPIPLIALENPVSCISSRIRKPDQIIQPYQFGHRESKRTCLWLKGLPLLAPTNVVEPVYMKNDDGTDYKDAKGGRYSPTHYNTWALKPKPRYDNQTPSGQNKLGPSPERWRERSRTYQGIADAMAEQWG